MKIFYRRTGGFAGMIMTFDVDTQTLPPEETEAVEELVAAADFFNLPAAIESESRGADRFQYNLTITTEERQHTITVGETAVPENLQPLLDKIRVLSRSR